MVDFVRLEEVARRLGYRSSRLVRVLHRLQYGADIGCRGAARLPTRVPNSPAALELGDRVADEILEWIKTGLAFGPALPEEMPWEDYTVNPILTRIKPNSKARIIVNMSAPYGEDEEPEDAPKAVNVGINKLEFPATMSSITNFSESLVKVGCPAKLPSLTGILLTSIKQCARKI